MSNTLWPQRAMSPSMSISSEIPLSQFGARIMSRAPLWAHAIELGIRRDFGNFQKSLTNQQVIPSNERFSPLSEKIS
jgi:hypothetical protein